MDNNKRLAKEIMAHVGGADNIASLNHCSTRLRLTVKNDEAFDSEAIKKIDGVLDVLKAMGGYQIIVGNNVSKVFKEITSNYGVSLDAKGGRVAGNPLEVLLNVLSDIMGPVIPAVVAAGLLSAVATMATMAGLSAESSTYQLIYTASQAPFYFLPFLVAYTSAKHWKLNPVLTLMMAGMMMYPSYTAMVDAQAQITLFGLPVPAVTYASSLVPIIFTCWAMNYIYHWLDKHCPESIRYVMVPFITIVIMIPVMFCITGPIGAYISQLISLLVTWLNETVPFLTVLIVSCLAPFLVLTGSHLGLLPIVISSFESYGFDSILFVAFIGMNFSQFAVSLAVFLKAKSSALKSTAFSTGLTAFLTGTTEPALYGLSLRLKKPLIATFIGCAANGLFCALTSVKTYAFGAPGFFTMVNFIDPNGSNNFYFAIGAAVITIVVTFAATWILGFDESGFTNDSEYEPAENNESVLISPVKGEIQQLSNIKDDVFSTGMMGDGIVILPEEDVIRAPISGEIIVVSPTNHAVGIRSKNGIEILIHVGFKSELLEDEFKANVREGDHVSAGEPVLNFNRKKLEKKGYGLETIVVVTNSKNYNDIIKTTKTHVTTEDNIIIAI